MLNIINKYTWAIVLIIAIGINGFEAGSLQYILTLFTTSMILSPIWWIITKKDRKKPWEWYDWLNTGSYIMIGLQVLSAMLE